MKGSVLQAPPEGGGGLDRNRLDGLRIYRERRRMEAVAAVPETPSGVRLKQEARKSRRRYYPSTILYTGYCVGVLALGLRSRHPYEAIAFFAAGMALWTPVEYLIHRYVLHGRFADGPGLFEHFLHKNFDPL